MLRKINDLRQESGSREKHWYASSVLDLFVWLNSAGAIERFEFSYAKLGNEKAILWDTNNGFSAVVVDDGARPGRHPLSPMYVRDDHFQPDKPKQVLAQHFGHQHDDLVLTEFISLISPWLNQASE